jgi:hypothetical protein
MAQVALAYARTGTEPPVTLQFAFVSDGETGGDAGLTTLPETSDFDPDARVVGETTDGRGERGRCLTAAIDELRSDFGQREQPVDASMDEIIGASVGFSEPEAGADATRRLYRYPTINLGTIEGGTATNAVPTSACARVPIDCRCRYRRGTRRHTEPRDRDGRHRDYGRLPDPWFVRTARERNRRSERERGRTRRRRARRSGPASTSACAPPLPALSWWCRRE